MKAFEGEKPAPLLTTWRGQANQLVHVCIHNFVHVSTCVHAPERISSSPSPLYTADGDRQQVCSPALLLSTSLRETGSVGRYGCSMARQVHLVSNAAHT